VAAARAARQPAPGVSMPELLREALRSPRELLGMLAALLVAMVLTSPLPIFWWVIASLRLAAVPGTILMNRVRLRAEHRARGRQPPAD
jgi:hypothetical protein